MGKFVSKPIVIEAVQLNWKNWQEIVKFMDNLITMHNHYSVNTYSDTCNETGPWIELVIPTLEGDMIARHGDWIIKGTKGEFYPCKPDVFATKYEEIND
jgi:hypothetical protein